MNNELKKYVRIKRVINEKFIEFDFAIGDPTLFVELVLPSNAFEAFCINNNVIELSEEECRAIDLENEKWRYGKETIAARNKRHQQ